MRTASGHTARNLTARLMIRSLIAGLLGIGAAAAVGMTSPFAAPEGDRQISFYHIHTKETLTVVYKKAGKYVPEAMEKIDWVMRDWRENKSIKMDPKAIDILWEMHTELGSKEPIHIICGYRSGATNNMLRRTVGGQAKNSNHITGTAIDVYFPDVPSKYVRYAGLVRERGGVGYYPTSALPFTHIDTGRVRHWPKIGKDELAMLFPSGRSKHVSSGGALRPGDHERAKARNASLYQQVAAYNDLHNGVGLRPVVIAADLPVPPAPKPAVRPSKPAVPQPAKQAATVLASFAPAAMPVAGPPAAAPAVLLASAAAMPALVAPPRLVERPSRFKRPTEKDRADLTKLVVMASLTPAASPPPRLVAEPSTTAQPHGSGRPAVPLETLSGADTPEGSYDPDEDTAARPSLSGWGSTFVPAPAYDDDHPEELSYVPFPLGPMLTSTASPDDPALTVLVHPDLAKTFEVLDGDGAILPMRFRPQQKLAEMMWAQQFHSSAVDVAAAVDEKPAPPAGLSKRPVRTTQR